jgi:outer membrane cobalamin receptor
MSLPQFYRVSTTWSLGIEAQGETLDQRSTFDTTTDSVGPSRSQQGYYTQLLFNWRQQAMLLVGVRVEDSLTFGVDTNPRVAASYTLPWTQTKLRGGYTTGIRAPSFLENFGTGSPFVVGNPNLKPEESLSWELGLDQPWFGGRVLLTTTYFHNMYKHLITFVSGPGPSFLNIGKAESSGVEAGVQFCCPGSSDWTAATRFLKPRCSMTAGSVARPSRRGSPCCAVRNIRAVSGSPTSGIGGRRPLSPLWWDRPSTAISRAPAHLG